MISAAASNSSSVVGVDVASRWLDTSWPDGKHCREPNTAAGWERLTRGADGLTFVMEATGVYYLGLARYATSAGVTVRVANPWQVHAFAASRLARTKTDKVDAALIRLFGERMGADLPVWYPMPVVLERVSVLVRFGDSLLRDGVAAGNRAHALGVAEASAVAAIGESVKASLVAERARVMDLALQAAEGDELVGGWLVGLRGLPGFGDVTGLRFLAYSGDLRRFGSARQFAAFTGLVPRFRQSGGGPEVGVMSRLGSRELRGILYWAAMTASRSDSMHGEFYRALRHRGKRGKVALVALANRLARAAWAVCVREGLTSET